ncbi:MAG: universal stress protein [Myxococcales bacterium]|nr:universal stress protein [Myxococcales bacterium]
MTSFTRIVVPTDFSETARHAFESAVALAQESHAELHICHAVEYVAPMVSPYEIPVPEDFIQQTREAAQNRLTEVVEQGKSAGLYCEGHLLSDRADPGISNLAEAIHADLIVMGSRGTGRLRHIFLGSVTERTVRHAPCSVLTIKPQDIQH